MVPVVPFPLLVPNVPCGVESTELADLAERIDRVPNVPCGVESFMVF